MTLSLEPAIGVGGWRVAALCEHGVAARRRRGAVVATVHKRPVAILFARDDVVTAFAPDGQPFDAAEVERLCPGAIAAIGGWRAAPREGR